MAIRSIASQQFHQKIFVEAVPPTIWAGKPRPYDWKRINLRRGGVPQPEFLVGVGNPTIWARKPRPYDWRRMNLRRGWVPQPEFLVGVGNPTIWAGKPRPYDWKRMNLRRGWGPPARIPRRGWVPQPFGRGNLAPTNRETPQINVNTTYALRWFNGIKTTLELSCPNRRR